MGEAPKDHSRQIVLPYEIWRQSPLLRASQNLSITLHSHKRLLGKAWLEEEKYFRDICILGHAPKCCPGFEIREQLKSCDQWESLFRAEFLQTLLS